MSTHGGSTSGANDSVSGEHEPAIIKIAIVGDYAVGKTAIVRRYINREFRDGGLKMTVGVDFAKKTCQVLGRKVSIQIWDTAGQERFYSLITSYLRSAYAIIVVCDVTRDQTILSIDQRWASTIDNQVDEHVPRIVCFNKTDELRRTDRQDFDRDEELVRKFTAVYKTSAKTGENIDSMFDYTINAAVQLYIDDERQRERNHENNQRINVQTPKAKYYSGNWLSSSSDGCC